MLVPPLEYIPSGTAQSQVQQSTREVRWQPNSPYGIARGAVHADTKNTGEVFFANENNFLPTRQSNPVMITHVPRVPEAIRSRILSFQAEEGWDLEEAKAISLAACQAAIQILETLLEEDAEGPIPQVSASVYGAVTLAWSKNNSHVAIRIFDEGATFYISEEPGGIRSRGYEERQKSIMRVMNFFNSRHAQQS